MPEISLISLIFSDNQPSIKLAEAIGATFERELEFRGQTAHIYRHSKEEA
jgi:RimJ/RimL family protein N-acetyltransferase